MIIDIEKYCLKHLQLNHLVRRLLKVFMTHSHCTGPGPGTGKWVWNPMVPVPVPCPCPCVV